ncbi:hypothetical protein AB6A40_001785 [Gnathostoma spinigerum]|uniref:Pyridine nucleotide-disulfide oxidoreductase domain-containing protein 1 n=1 Tax=Gnathostoma spinigerum TaxID=75299 RepID=A0ABD6E7E5_9BILA
MEKYEYVIVGGGVAAVSCAEELRCTDENAQIALISASPLLKTVANRVLIGQLTESFDIAERSAADAFTDINIRVIKAKVINWDAELKQLQLDNGSSINYDKLCIATGAHPKENWAHPLVLSIRDTETVERIRQKIADAKRVVVIGNGGIATEIVYELRNVDIVWAIRHSSISHTFFDVGAAEFLKPMLISGHQGSEESHNKISKRLKITVDKDEDGDKVAVGCALGPDWTSSLDIVGALKKRSVNVIYNVEMEKVISEKEAKCCLSTNSMPLVQGEWPLYIRLTNGQAIGCDIVIQATGVEPNSGMWRNECDKLEIAPDGGIVVDESMMSSVKDVYACGDVCTAGWVWSKHWFQMRLWTQARQMGAFCGRAMAVPEIPLDFCFELFTHVTYFFGFKVIFLGRYNGEGVEKPWHALLRVTPNKEYVKLIVHNGRIQGALLIGETNLEEVVENLILNQIDITDQEEGLLDPNIDIDDYFD